MDTLFGGSAVCEIEFAPIHSEKIGLVAAMDISMSDDSPCEFYEGGFRAWPLVYRIETDEHDEDIVYEQRWIWIYFGVPEDTNIRTVLIKKDWEKNLYQERFRPPDKFIDAIKKSESY